MVHISGAISGPHLKSQNKIWFQRISVNIIFREGFKFSMLSGVLVPKQAFKKGMVAIAFLNSLLWWFLVYVSTRFYERGGKKPIKQDLFCHSLLESRRSVKRRERPEITKKTQPFFWGGGP